MRRKLILFAILCLLFIWRWGAVKSPLPESWTPGSKVRFTARILEKPELTDSKTVIRQGQWKVQLKSYVPLEVGREYAFVGRVEPELLLGKVTRITMVEPTFEVIEGASISIWERVVIGVNCLREKLVARLASWLPEPHSSLAAGILLGVRRQMPWEFYQQLVSTGTLHIVAASGYNVMVVARVLMGAVLLVASRGVAILIGIVGILIYVILAGGSAAVVRAGIMGTLTLVAYYWGRPTEARRLLWVTVAGMLIVQPLMLVDIGFQLSVAATAGLLYLEPRLEKKFGRKGRGGKYLKEYWWPTVAATLATLPVTLYWFGRASLLGPVVNALVLPVTPLIMLLSAVAVGVGALIPALGQVVSYLLYVPLWWMVETIRVFGS